jgi:ubiquinone/menaquinone biosynthesis C-methylase UbiE
MDDLAGNQMKNKLGELSLLPLDALVKTGDVDHADWNHKLFLGTLARSRFHLVRALLGARRGQRLLEIGYGSGVFLPELAKYAEEVYGIDIHQEQKTVTEKLSAFGVTAELVSRGAESMPWSDDFFDFVIAVSALEFVSDLDSVCLEVKRTLQTSGSFVVVTPGQSPLLDFGLKILTGKSAKEDFADRRSLVLPTLLKHFDVRKEITYPRRTNSLVRLYTALELNNKQ